jgi:membrane-associated PAP2 superfamily phosphatase
MKRKFKLLIVYMAICIFFYVITIDPRINYLSHLFGFVTGNISYLFCVFISRHFFASDTFRRNSMNSNN